MGVGCEEERRAASYDCGAPVVADPWAIEDLVREGLIIIEDNDIEQAS